MHICEVARIIFNHDYGIVHEDSERENECKKRNPIDIEPKDERYDKDDSKHHRDTKCSIEGILESQKYNQDHKHNQDAHEEMECEFIGSLPSCFSLVLDYLYLDVLRKSFLELFNLFEYVFHHRYCIGSLRLGDPEKYGVF